MGWRWRSVAAAIALTALALACLPSLLLATTLVDSAIVPVATTIGLFALFAGLTAVTWAYFRFRPGRAGVPSG